MKKITLSTIFVIVFVFYALYQRMGTLNSTKSNSITDTVQNNVLPVSSNQSTTTTQTPVTQTPVTTTPVNNQPAPTPIAKAQYKDGTFTGQSADAYYGNIQVQAVISGGKIVDVVFLDYPKDRNHSIAINTEAMPYLKQEAISAQSANVNIVSGATDSSQAFQISLASALTLAKN